jgi:Domain of unknown function (DUF5659)
VSTEQTTLQHDRRRVAVDRLDAFETRDFYLACFLKCVGYELADLRSEGRRRVFVFKDRPGRRGDVMAFYGNASSVRPLAFTATIKDMKALIHNV